MKFTAANILTGSRLVLTPVFLVLLVIGAKGAAFAVFCIAGATDLIDGTVARMLKQHSQGGAILDPIADKLLVQSCFISLAVLGVLPWWFAILALARDAMIVGGIIYLELNHISPQYKPAIVSKITTVFQLGVAVLGIVSIWKPGVSIAGFFVGQLIVWMIYITALLIVVSGVKYVSMGMGILKERQ